MRSFCLSASSRASRAPALGAALASAGAPERRGAVAVGVARPSVARRGSVSASVGRRSSSTGSIQPGAACILELRYVAEASAVLAQGFIDASNK